MLDDPVNASIVVLHDCVTSHAVLRGSSKDRKILFGREKSTKSVGVIATGLHNGFVARVFLLAAIATIYNISRCLINAKTRRSTRAKTTLSVFLGTYTFILITILTQN